MRKIRKRIETDKHVIKNLVSSLIIYEKIKTTESKAKLIRPVAEKIITRSKNDTLANRRYIFSHLPQKEAAKKVIEELSKHYKDRPGGYTRIIKLGQRSGDAAKVSEISLVE